MIREQKINELRQYIIDNGLNKKDRHPETVYKRDYLYNYMKTILVMNLTEIGREFKRGHATVIHGLKTGQNLVNDKYFNSITKEVQLFFPLTDVLNEIPDIDSTRIVQSLITLENQFMTV